MIGQVSSEMNCAATSAPGANDIRIVPITAKAIPAVVKIHRDAFQGYMNTRLGDGYIKAFIEWFQQAEQNISLLALDESEDRAMPAGYVVGAPWGWDAKLNRDLFWFAAVRAGVRPWLLFNEQFRRTIAVRLGMIKDGGLSNAPPHPVLPEPTMSLVGIGVATSARGKGCGILLLEAFEQRARELRMRSMNLSVYPDNAAARKLYEKMGWQPFVVPARKRESMFYSKTLT